MITQINLMCDTIFNIKQEIEDSQMQEKRITKFENWIDDLNNKHLFVFQENLSYFSVLNMSDLLKESFKFFLFFGIEDNILNNILKIFLKSVFNPSYLSTNNSQDLSHFSMIDFVKKFSKLKLDVEIHLPLIEMLCELLGSWKNMNEMVEIGEEIWGELKTIHEYNFQNQFHQFTEEFVCFIQISSRYFSMHPFLEIARLHYEKLAQPNLFEKFEDLLKFYFHPKLREEESQLEDYPSLEINLPKLDVLLDFTEHKSILEKEINFLEKRLFILKQKSQLINTKIENQSTLESLQPLLQSFKQQFQKEKQTIESNFQRIPKKSDFLEKFEQTFEKFLNFIDNSVQAGKSEFQSQLVNIMPKLKADLQRNFFPLFSDTQSFQERLEKTVHLCSSMRNFEYTAPSEPPRSSSIILSRKRLKNIFKIFLFLFLKTNNEIGSQH